MKKKIAAIILAIMLIATLSVASGAELLRDNPDIEYYPVCIEGHDTINYGTPVVDGRLDAMYADSFQMKSPSQWQPVGEGDALGDQSDATCTTYMLWDENYLYILSDVYDSTLDVFQDEAWVREHIETGDATIYLWRNNSVEHFINWYGRDGEVTDTQLWSVDAYGVGMYSGFGISYYEGYEDATFASTIDVDGGHYTIEMMIPNVEGLGEGDEIGFFTQLNDLIDFANRALEHFNNARVVCYFADEPNKAYENVYELTDNGANPHDAPIVRPTQGPTEVSTEAPTQGVSENATQGGNQGATEASTQASTNGGNTDSGCGSAVMSTVAVISMACAAAVVLKKKN